MARGFGSTRGSGTTDKVVTGYSTLTAGPRSYHIWIKRYGDGGGTLGRIWDTGAAAAVGDEAFFNAGDQTIRFQRQFTGGFAFWGMSWPGGTGTNLGVWFPIGFAYDASSASNDPVPYLNGTAQSLNGDSNSTGTADTTANAYCLGNRASDNARVWDGDLAWWAMWSVILNAAEFAALARGVPAYRIRPQSLLTCCPLFGLHSPEIDFVKGNASATVTGTALRTGPPVTMTTPKMVYFTPPATSPPPPPSGGIIQRRTHVHLGTRIGSRQVA